MSGSKGRIELEVHSLSDLADSMALLESVIQDLVLTQSRLEITDSSVILNGPGLADFWRHLKVLLSARSARFLINGLRRMAPMGDTLGNRTGVSSSGDACRQTASEDGRVVSVSSIDDIFISVKQFGSLVRGLGDGDCHLLLAKEEIDTRSDRDREFVRNVGLISDFDGQLHRKIGRQNQAAAAADGRQSGPRPKLNVADREQVRRLYEAGHLTVAEIAQGFGVGRGTVYRALDETDSGRRPARHSRERRSPAVPQGAFQYRRGDAT